jgi:ornithine--oxo-acid transaminase
MIIIPLLERHRVLTQVAGYHTEVIKFLPPMVATQEDMDWFLTAIEDVLEDVQRIPGSAWATVSGLAKRAMLA